MPRKAKELTALEVRRLAKKPGKHAVGGVSGLLLQVKDTKSASWILRIKIGDRRPDIGLGGFPDVNLESARERAREIRDQVYQGIDPLAVRRESQAELRRSAAKSLTFDQATDAVFRVKSREFKSTKHRSDWNNSMKTYASPVIGRLAVDEIELAHVVKVLEPIWVEKTDTASRLRGRIESVLSWATVSGYRKGDNPARWKGNLDHVLPTPKKVRKVKHLRALRWQEMGAFMSLLRTREGMGARALEFAILTAARSGEVRLATWDEIDLEAKVWTIPDVRMKAGRVHRVPLSEPVLELLEALPRFEGSEYVFPATRGGALSDMSLSAVTRRMGVDAVPHGFRSTFKDWCRSATSYPDEVSELALAHVSSDGTRAAYARDELLAKRARLMRDWARFCEQILGSTGVTTIAGHKP